MPEAERYRDVLEHPEKTTGFTSHTDIPLLSLGEQNERHPVHDS